MINKQQETKYQTWLEGYLCESDGQVRKTYLDRGLAEESGPAMEFRKKLWEKRFLDEKGELTGADYFIGQLMELKYQQKRLDTFILRGLARKSLKKIHAALMLQEAADAGLSEVLKEELINLLMVYMDVSWSDKSYNSILMRIGTMKDRNLIYKMARDIHKLTYMIPMEAGVLEEFSLLTAAGEEAFLLFSEQDRGVWEEAVKANLDYKK